MQPAILPTMLNVVVFSLLILPWLNPFAPGSSPAVMPLLFSWACVAALLGLRVWRVEVIAPARLAAVVAGAWLLAGLISSGMGLLQYFDVAAGWAPWVNVTVAGEAFANLRQRNQFATLTNMALMALLWCSWQIPGAALLKIAGACLAAALLVLGNVASSSRTGLLQLALVVGLALWWGGWRRPAVRAVVVVSALGYAVAVWGLPWLAGFDAGSHGIVARLRDQAQACSSRRLLWSNVLDLIVQKPWLGWGWGELDFAHYTNLYGSPRFCEILDNAHNLPLHLAVELGVPVALLLCAALTVWVLRQRPWQEPDPTRQLAWGVLAVIGLHSLLEYPLWYGPFQIAVLACVLLLRRSPEMVPEAKNEPKRPIAQVFVACAATFLIAFLSFSAWDYWRVSQIYLESSERDPSLRDNTLAKISNTRLFRNQLLFAELGITPLTVNNAQWTYDTASELLHYSPEPRVIEKVIESATMLGREDEAVLHLARYRAAFPADCATWLRGHREKRAEVTKDD